MSHLLMEAKPWCDTIVQTRTSLTIKMICLKCGSENVTRDGLLKWSVPDQVWEMSAELDNTQCDDCGAENCVEEKDVD